MSSSELANWDGSQSAQKQRQEQLVNRIVQPRAGTANTSGLKHGQREEQFDASLRTIEVNGHANREETGLAKVSQESTIRNTPKPAPDISRIFDEVKVEIVDFNGRWREDSTHTLYIEDTAQELIDGGDAMVVDQMLHTRLHRQSPHSTVSKLIRWLLPSHPHPRQAMFSPCRHLLTKSWRAYSHPILLRRLYQEASFSPTLSSRHSQEVWTQQTTDA
ncbi:hypothetical protein FPV67DRAFT_1222625 [Lyophyllum atratum]|nr:hypothetical protein FPV67DRAFT_1222625 [Lyophyllum atratum]